MSSAPSDLYQQVTDRIIEMLEQGVAPWRSPIMGTGTAGHPKNLISGRGYRGINVLLLAFAARSQGYGSACWLTFKQAQARGGSVRKGEKSSLVVFWKQYETEDRDTGKPKLVPVLRHYRVFNAEQCDGIDAPDAAPFEPIDFEPLSECERIAHGYPNGPQVQHAGSRAYYRPSDDLVRLPEPQRFTSPEEYYSTRLPLCRGEHPSRDHRELGRLHARLAEGDQAGQEARHTRGRRRAEGRRPDPGPPLRPVAASSIPPLDSPPGTLALGGFFVSSSRRDPD